MTLLTKSQKSLDQWTAEEWDNVSGKKGDRYLPKKVRQGLTAAQKAATNRKKRKAGGVGSRAKYSKKVASRVGAISKLLNYVKGLK